MKIVINNDSTNNKELVYEESFWSGKKKVAFDGKQLTMTTRTTCEYVDGEKTEVFVIKGNQFTGLTITMFGKEIVLSKKMSALEITLSIIILIPCMLFGAIGGAIGAVFAFSNLVFMRKVEKLWIKIVVSIGAMLVAGGVSYAIATFVFNMVNPLF